MAITYSVGAPPGATPATTAPASAMAGPWDRRAVAPGEEAQPAPPQTKAAPATETIGRRAGALSDEIDFPQFVSSLIHGTFDAIVEASIRQMDSFADLVTAVAKPLERFKDENVTANEARDWLIAQHPRELMLARGEDGASVVPRAGEDDESPPPAWLSDFGLGGQRLTAELIEAQLVPAARDRVARDRMATLSTMVMLGLNRVVVKDGTIAARLRFRAAAADRTRVDYAVSDDQAMAGGGSSVGGWGSRGSTAYAAPSTKVSTVGINSQTDSDLKAELFGEVKINFASETVPLDRFVDDARRVMLERAARPAAIAPPASPTGPVAAPPVAPATPVTP